MYFTPQEWYNLATMPEPTLLQIARNYLFVSGSYWWFLAGGVLMTFLAFYKHFHPDGKDLILPKWARWASAVLCLYLAQFMAYRNQTLNLAKVVEEKRQFSMKINALDTELADKNQLLQQSVERENECKSKLSALQVSKSATRATVSSSGSQSPPIGSLQQGPGSAFSQNQSGGVTAGTINVDTRKHLVLGDAQQDGITDGLRRFKGRSLEIFFHNATPETEAFGKRLQTAMEAAGITVQVEGYGTSYANGPVAPGVSLSVGDDNLDIAKAISELLVWGAFAPKRLFGNSNCATSGLGRVLHLCS
jgi:hypothetical protein